MPVPTRTRARPRFSPPRGRSGVLRRQRLLARLEAALDATATLLVAPAGFGKTTLVGDWLRETEIPAAWLSLNATHRDARALVVDIVAALARLHPAVEALGDQLRAGDGPQAASAMLFELARALDDAEDFAIFVIDDLDELIGAEEAHAVLDRLLAQPLPAVHTVLLSRQPPPLTSRPRKTANGDLVLLDATELAFTSEEAEALLDGADILDPAARAATLERARGWPLALALLAERAARGTMPGDATSVLALDEFIRAEVLDRLSAEDRVLLEACAVPTYFDGDIAAELTGRTDGGAALRRLQGHTQLIEALGAGPSLRMHGLLREHCLATLAREHPARLAELRERAAGALTRRGELDEATALALDAEAWPLARDLIERQVPELNGRGAWTTLAGWLGRLPRDVLHEAHALALLEVRVAIRLTRLQEAHALLDGLNLAALPPGAQAHALLYRAVAFRQARRLDDARREHRRARALIEEHEPAESLLRVEADLDEGVTLGMAGELPASIRLLERAATGAERLGGARLTAEANGNLGHALQLADRLGAAREAMREAKRRWDHLGEREFQLLMVNNEATIAQTLGDLDEAKRGYHEVWERSEGLGVPRLRALAALGLADVARDRSDLYTAEAQYDIALGIGREIDHAGIESSAAFGKAMALRERGALPEARSLLEHHLQITQEQGTNEFASRFRVGLAGVLLSESRPAEALDVLALVLEGPGRGFQRRQLALLMTATAEFRLGRSTEAELTLTRLQQLVEALGYDQFLVAEARLASDLLSSSTAEGLPGRYFPRLLERAGRAAAPSPSPPSPPASGPDFIVRAFGTPAVTRPGDPAADLAWRSERSRELFLFLLAQPSSVSREDVEAALWPEASPSRLSSLFHSSLHRVRKAAGEGVVVHDRGGYYLDPALRIDYDVRDFEALIEAAERATTEPERRRALQAAVALRRGSFARSIDSAWAEAIRERLDDRYLAARLALAASDLAAGRYAEAVAHAEAALETDPLNEEAVRHLIAAHVGAGHPDVALRAYRRLQDLLQRDASALPSAATLDALERGISGVRPTA